MKPDIHMKMLSKMSKVENGLGTSLTITTFHHTSKANRVYNCIAINTNNERTRKRPICFIFARKTTTRIITARVVKYTLDCGENNVIPDLQLSHISQGSFSAFT